MDTATAVATWIGTVATAIGLASLVAQATEIRNSFDRYYGFRDAKFLGPWAAKQPSHPWYQLHMPDPNGPIISADIMNGFCGYNTLYLSRLPASEQIGKASWAKLLSVIHPRLPSPDDSLASILSYFQSPEPLHAASSTRHEWLHLNSQPLIHGEKTAYLTISRATLVIILILSNARQSFKHSGDAGYRASFPSYIGIWSIEWSIGKPAVVRLFVHDLFAKRSFDKYPRFFPQRVDKCIDMLAGVMDDCSMGLQVAFPGRKAPGKWILQLQKRGYPGAHGSRHFYNMVGGKVYEFDFLFLRRVDEISLPQPTHTPSMSNASEDVVYTARFEDRQSLLTVPSLVANQPATIVLERDVFSLLPQVLDHLPWTHLSWSMHRGMRDILLAFGKGIMDVYRQLLAKKLKQAVTDNVFTLVETRGWKSDFVQHSMPDMVYSTIMSGSGDSGDLVRVITDAALLLCDGNYSELDRTSFWKRTMRRKHTEIIPHEYEMPADSVVALTKFVVLEWSQEFDYQMYHHLPTELYFD